MPGQYTRDPSPENPKNLLNQTLIDIYDCDHKSLSLRKERKSTDVQKFIKTPKKRQDIRYSSMKQAQLLKGAPSPKVVRAIIGTNKKDKQRGVHPLSMTQQQFMQFNFLEKTDSEESFELKLRKKSPACVSNKLLSPSDASQSADKLRND